MEFNNDYALKFFKNGAIFVAVDVPTGTEFGIDLKVWYTDHKFKGVKMIPPGPHFLYYSSKNVHGDTGPRTGFFHAFSKGEIMIRKWNSSTEDFSVEEVGVDEYERFRQNLPQLDQFLGSYPYEIYNKWKSLTKHITGNVITKLNPKEGLIRSVSDFVTLGKVSDNGRRKRWSKCRTDEERQEDMLPELVPVEGTQIRYTEMPSQRYPAGSSSAEITMHYLDSTYALNQMLSNCVTPLDFVGEIQFAFLCFLIGLNLDAFEQWKKLVQLLCNCMKAIKRFPLMYSEFTVCLKVQLEEIPEDFLIDIVANNNIIYRSLRDLFANLDLLRTEIDGRLYCLADRLKNDLTSKFGWDFTNLEIEEGDEAPVVVVSEK